MARVEPPKPLASSLDGTTRIGVHEQDFKIYMHKCFKSFEMNDLHLEAALFRL